MKKIMCNHPIDFVIVNGENLAHGRGITADLAMQLWNAGVDIVTTGNHVWDQKEISPFLEQTSWIIRPANFPSPASYPCPGKGSCWVESRKSPNKKLGVIQVMGRVFMDTLDCPFQSADRELQSLRSEGIQAVLVDFHGEASSEKQAFAHYMDGRVGAVVGSHSHVQTADERILPGGTAAITDVGMTGCFDSVIGVKKETSIRRFLTKRPVKFEPAEGPAGYGAVIVEINSSTGLASRIVRLRESEIEYAEV